MQEAGGEPGRVVSRDREPATARIGDRHRIRLGAHDAGLGLPEFGQVGGDEEHAGDGRVVPCFGDDGAAVGVTDDDGTVDGVEHRTERLRVGDQAGLHVGLIALAAGRQLDRSTADAGALEEQLRDRPPPPLAVSNECAVNEDRFHADDANPARSGPERYPLTAANTIGSC
ncbi:hypothetical protein L3i23_29360 [Herbiconiux sp. L3-i23]|nr:hypothetical protein L3i23_29360 [Herbiconiux sp. L3-i23]